MKRTANRKRGNMLTTTLTKTAITTFACLLLMIGVAHADVKVKSRQTSGGQTVENTSYIKGKRERTEMGGGQMINVQQCDLRRNIQIMPQARAYMIQPYDQPTTLTTNASATVSSPSTKGGVITSTVTTKDTGERKQMFGYTARHIITTIVMDSTPDACSPVKSKMEFDGWYIDAAFALDCGSQTYTAYQNKANGGCHDRYETKQIGTARRGYAVWEKTTMFDQSGNPSFSTLNEVIELSQATLDQALFEIPDGYHEVKDFASAYAMSNSASTSGVGSGAINSNTGNESGFSDNVKNMATQTSDTTSSAPAAKKEGVVRLGLANVKTGSVGEGLSARDLAAAVQNSLTEYLKMPNLEVVPLEAKLASAIDAEAKEKQCDFIIYASVSHKKGGGSGFGSMFGGTGASLLGSSIGYGAGTGAAVAAQVTSQAVMAATMSENIKAKDEITLDIKLQAPGSSTVTFAKQYKQKAKSAGEDIISPVIEQAAQAIVDATKR
jgi:hypothetical protein